MPSVNYIYRVRVHYKFASVSYQMKLDVLHILVQILCSREKKNEFEYTFVFILLKLILSYTTAV